MTGRDEAAERMTVPDALDDTFAALYARGWTDGLPVVPPTPERVERMQSGVRHAASMVIARVPPAMEEATVEAIAVNAVMAGCVPEYMPVLVAAVRAVCRPEFNLAAIQGTGSPTTAGLLVNGPIRTRLEMNCGEGAAGPGWRANATIGRALRLILQNVGGARPGGADKAVFGQPAKYTFCLGENEEQSPWEPFHVERGFRPADSTVTAVAVQYVQFLTPAVRDAEETLRLIARGMAVMAHENVLYRAPPATLVFPIAGAKLLQKQGFSKARVKAFLYEHARLPVSELPRGEKLWPFKPLVVNDEVLVVSKPEDIVLVVAGGVEGFGFGPLYLGGWESVPVTEAIRNVEAHSGAAQAGPSREPDAAR